MVKNVSENVHIAIKRVEDIPIIVPNCLLPLTRIKTKNGENGGENGENGNGENGGNGDENDGGNNLSASCGDERKPTRRKSLTLLVPLTLQEQLIKLKKKEKHLSYWLNVGVCVDGRKIARKELRLFLRIFRKYFELPAVGKKFNQIMIF